MGYFTFTLHHSTVMLQDKLA